MSPTSLVAVLATAFLTLVSAEQRVFSQDSTTGVLRRFNVESAVPLVLQLAQEYNLDVWHASRSFVDVYSPPDESFLPKELADLPHTTTHLPTTSKPRPLSANTDWNVSSLQNSTFHESYHPLFEIESFLSQLTAAYPNITRRTNLGESAVGREMIALTISTGGYEREEQDGKKKKKKQNKKKTRTPISQDGEKLGFVIVGAQHAREWIATATSLYLAHALTVDPSLSMLLKHFDFHFIPVPNPDGYDYTWETDRFWYKNRQVLGPYTKCIGLDMNRNWGYKWKPTSPNFVPRNDTQKPRDPTNPCSHWYPGMRPFESYEVNNMANWIGTLPNIVGFIDLRSYGQMLSSPYSYSCKRWAKDAEDQIDERTLMSSPVEDVHQLLGSNPLSPQLAQYIALLSTKASITQHLIPEVKSYPDAVYCNYFPIGLSLLYTPAAGYKPTSGLKLDDLKHDKLSLDSIYLYNVPIKKQTKGTSSRAAELAFSTYPLSSFSLNITPEAKEKDGKPISRPPKLDVHTETSGKDFVLALGEPDRKGGGAGPSSGSIGIWCEWTKDGIMVEFGGDEAKGPQAWERGKDAIWKIITVFSRG